MGLTEALHAFKSLSAGADVSLVFYAGHGLEMDGVNYVVPVDAQLEHDVDVQFETLMLDDLLVSTAGAALRLVILDASRHNPLARSMKRTPATRTVSGGSFGDLNAALLGDGTLVAYAAAAGTKAARGGGRNSPYTAALLTYLKQPLELTVLFRRVRAHVLEATHGEQRPHEYASLRDEHYLTPSAFDLKPFRDGNKFVFIDLHDEPPVVPVLSELCPTGGERCTFSAERRIRRAERDLEAYNTRKDRQGFKPIYEAQLAGDVPIWGQDKVRRAARAAERNAGMQWAPQAYATMMVRLRQLHGQSNPVPPPSFMPKGTLQFLGFHPVAPNQNHTSTTAIDFTFGHHSNGQRDCPFLDQMRDEDTDKCRPLESEILHVSDINSRSGNFSTHYRRVRVHHRRRGESWQWTLGGALERHLSSPDGAGGTLPDDLADRYGRTRAWFIGDVGYRPVYFRLWWGRIGHGSAVKNGVMRGLELFVYLKSKPDVALYIANGAGQDAYNINFESGVRPPFAIGVTYSWGTDLRRSLPNPF